MSDEIICTIIDSDRFIFPTIEEKILTSISSEDAIIKCLIEDQEVLNINFIDEEIINVLVEGGGSGGTGTVDWNDLHNYIVSEDLTTEVDGIITDFTTNFNFYSTSLKVFLNGLKEKIITILTDNSFRITPAPEIGDYLEVEYIKKSS